MDNTSLTGHKLNSLNTLCILQNEDEKQVSGSDFYHRIYRRQFVKRIRLYSYHMVRVQILLKGNIGFQLLIPDIPC